MNLMLQELNCLVNRQEKGRRSISMNAANFHHFSLSVSTTSVDTLTQVLSMYSMIMLKIMQMIVIRGVSDAEHEATEDMILMLMIQQEDTGDFMKQLFLIPS